MAQVAAGELASTEFDYSTDTGYSITYTLSDLGLSNSADINEMFDAADAVFDSTYDFNTVLHTLIVDCPYELYWFDKTKINATGISHTTSVTYTSAIGYSIVIDSIQFKLYVAEAYQEGGNGYTVDTEIAQSASAVVEVAQGIVDKYASYSDEEKLKAYKDEICSMVSYNNSAASNSSTPYGNPWQLIWVFDDDDSTNVVCEGYAKAFKYLCDLTAEEGLFEGDVTCYTVDGTMSGGTGAGDHMWNIVTLDGCNYLVDVTNSDTGTIGQNGGLFLSLPSNSGATDEYGYGVYSDTYTFTAGSSNVVYTYDGYTIDLYSESILTLGKIAPTVIDIEVAFENNVTEYTYTGSEIQPAIIVTDDMSDGTTHDESSYSVEYSDNINVGTATVTVTAETENGTATATLTFTIVPKEITADISGTVEKIYDGTMEAGGLTITLVGVVDGDDVTATAEYAYDSADTGTDISVTGTITLSGTAAGNYTLEDNTISTTGTITPITLTEAMVSGIESSYYYTGSEITPTVTVTDGNLALIANTDYAVSYSDNTNAGTATVIVTGKGNYTGTVTRNFEIAYIAAPEYVLSGTEGLDGWYVSDVTLTADGWTVSTDQSTWEESVTFTESADETEVYFKQNDTGYLSDACAVSVQIDQDAPVYEDEATGIELKSVWYKTLLKTISFGLLFNENVTATIQATDAISGVATYYYYLDNSGEILTAAELDDVTFTETEDGTLAISDEDQYVIYAYAVDNAGNKSVYICSEGFILDMTPMEITVSIADEDVEDTSATGSITVNEAGTLYYLLSTESTLSVDELMAADDVVSVDVVADESIALDLTDLTQHTQYYVYAAGVDAAGNVNTECAVVSFITAQTTPVVQEAPMLAGVYGTAVSGMTISGGVVTADGEEISGTWSITDANADDLPVVDTDAAYEVTFTPEEELLYTTVTATVVPTVTAKEITVIIENASRTYGEANPAFACTVAGDVLVGTDTQEDLDIVLSTEADTGSDVGTYAITGTWDNANYQVTFVEGTLTITQADQTVAIAAIEDKTYGDADFTLEVTAVSEELTYVSGNETVVTVAEDGTVSIVGAGTATITVTAAATNNYKEGSSTVTITVGKADQTVTIADVADKTYGDSDFTLDVTAESDDLSYESSDETVLTVASNGTISIVGAGTATITVTAAATSNYKEGSATVTITVGKADQTVTIADVDGKTYGDDTFTLDITAESSNFTYESSDTTVLTVADDGTVSIVGAGTATITVTAAETANYNSGSATVTITVGKADQTVSIANVDAKTYGDDDFTLDVTAGSSEFTYKSSNESVLTVSEDGTVSIMGVGEATITVTAEANTNYNSATGSVTITVDKADSPAIEETQEYDGSGDLADALPDGWKIDEDKLEEDADLDIKPGQAIEVPVVYNGDDADCYENTEDTVTIVYLPTVDPVETYIHDSEDVIAIHSTGMYQYLQSVIIRNANATATASVLNAGIALLALDVDGEDITSYAGADEDGSTIITLNPEFLDSLDGG